MLKWDMSMNRDGQKLIKGEGLIRVSRVEKSSEINKRACPIIRHLRVQYLLSTFWHILLFKHGIDMMIFCESISFDWNEAWGSEPIIMCIDQPPI